MNVDVKHMGKGERILSYSMILLLIVSGMTIHIVLPNEMFPINLTQDVTGSFAGGNGTSINPFQISNITQLQSMSDNLSAHYILINDINASETIKWNDGKGFDPIGNVSSRFSGKLEGQKKNITDLFINRPSEHYVGLFGSTVWGAIINDVALIDNEIIGYLYVGGLVGYNNGTVIHSNDTGTVGGNNYVGGLIGCNSGMVTDSSTYMNVNGNKFVGGLIGDNRGTLTNSYATGNTIGTGTYVGGLVGINSDMVTYSYSSGNVTGDKNVGGLVGHNSGMVANSYTTGNTIETRNDFGGGLVGSNGGTVTKSYANGNTIGFGDFVGGLMGSNGGKVTYSHSTGLARGNKYVGGLVGNNNGTVIYSFATGNTIGFGDFVGGLVGFNWGKVNNSYATGSIIGTGNNFLGGLIGCNEGTMTNSYATGTNTGTGNYVGGLVGQNPDGTVIFCFWDIETTGKNTGIGVDNATGALGKTTDEMMDLITFKEVGWDIAPVLDHESEIWYIDEGYDYPRLHWEPYEDTHPPVADAGIDQWIIMENTATFDGSGSTDNVGIASYIWTFFDGIEMVFLEGPSPHHKFTVPGIYMVTLNISDVDGNWATDTMFVTVNDTTPPIAYAGINQTVGEGDHVILNGSGSTDNVGIASYIWTFFDGIEKVYLEGPSPHHKFTVPGIYMVTLNISDVEGNWATDTMFVTVNDTTPPIAYAGADRIIGISETIILDGSGSIDNGYIAKWKWNFLYNGEFKEMEGEIVELSLDIPGEYIVHLNVYDQNNNMDTDEVNITVLDDDIIDDDDDIDENEKKFPIIFTVIIVVIIFLFIIGLFIFILMRENHPEEE